jgi:hypothetical protein
MFLVFQRKLLLADKTKIIQFVLFFLAETNKKSVSSFISVLLSNVLDNCQTSDHISSTNLLNSCSVDLETAGE